MSWSSLHQAALDGSMRLTRALLSGRSSADIDRRTDDGLGFTPLALAAQEGHYSVVHVLLESGARQSVRSDGGCTALIISAIHGHARVSTLLIDRGAEVEASDCNGVTALYSASLEGHPKVVKLLIEAGAGVNICASDGCMPLHPSSKDGHLTVVKLLVVGGARVGRQEPGGLRRHAHGRRPGALRGGRDAARGRRKPRLPHAPRPDTLVKVLLRAKASPALPVSRPDGGIGVALDAAAQNGQSGTVGELLQLGIAVCGGADRGEGALRLIAQNGHLGVLTMLVDAGVVNTGVALGYATDSGQEACVKFLLRQEWAAAAAAGGREYVNRRNKHGLTPLQFSAWSACPRITRRLLDAGADEKLLCKDYARVGGYFVTPVALTTYNLEKKTHRGLRATEEVLHQLEAIRRLLMRVEAVRAVSCLWVSNASCPRPALEEAGDGPTAVGPTAPRVPVSWRRRRVRNAFASAVVRHSNKP